MCWRSASRQPCSIGSCMVVTRKRPSGLTVTPRWEPFHSSFSGTAPAHWETTAWRRYSARCARRKPFGGRRGRRRSTALRTGAAPCGCTNASCPPTMRPRRPGRSPRDRSSGAWGRWRGPRVMSAVVATTLPSSPPVTTRVPSLAAARMRTLVHRDAAGRAVGRGKHERVLAEHENRGGAEEMRGDHRAASRDRAGAVDDGDGVVAVSVMEPLSRVRRCSFRSLRGSSCPAGCGR